MTATLVVALNDADAFDEAEALWKQEGARNHGRRQSAWLVETELVEYRIVTIGLLGQEGLPFGVHYDEAAPTRSFAELSTPEEWRIFRLAQTLSWPRAGGVPA